MFLSITVRATRITGFKGNIKGNFFDFEGNKFLLMDVAIIGIYLIDALQITLERKAEASQQLMQALMRFILIAVPVAKCDTGSKVPALLPEAGGERAVIEVVLCLQKPPKDAIPQLLIFFCKTPRNVRVCTWTLMPLDVLSTSRS